MKSFRSAWLLLFWAMLIISSPSKLWGQTTFTYNGSAWSDGVNTVSYPVLNGQNSIVVSQPVEEISQTASGAVINSRYSIIQTFSAPSDGSIDSLFIWALSIPSSTYTVTARIYEGDPLSTHTLLGTSTQSTGLSRIDFWFSTPVTITGGSSYFILIENQAANLWTWSLGPNGSYPNETLYLPFNSTTATTSDARSLRFKLSLMTGASSVVLGQTIEQPLGGAVINSRYSLIQTFTPAVSGEVDSLYLWFSTAPSSSYSVEAKIYSGDPLGGNTLLGTASQMTGGAQLGFEFSPPITLNSGQSYFILVPNQSSNLWTWSLGPSGTYSSEQFYIPFNSTTPTQADFRSLRFRLIDHQNFGNVTVAPSTSMVLGGVAQLSGTVTLNADQTGYAQLKIDGTISGTGSVVQNMYVSGTGYHALASSMAGGFGTTSASTGGLYSYNASTGAYDFSPSLSAAGMGYFGLLGTGGFVSSAGTFSVSGTPNTSHTHSLGYASTVASGGSGNGWNLVGNPYTCALD